MRERALARINWLLPQEGGRSALPTGLKYATVAHFGEDQPEPMWSLIVESTEPLERAQSIIAYVRCLVAEDAPVRLLALGNQFKLVEGKRVIATGEIINKSAKE